MFATMLNIAGGCTTILTEDNESRESLREHLKKNAIETRPIFYPVHTMPMYSQKYQQHKVAENLGWRGINLPSYPDLEEKDIDVICQCIKGFFLRHGIQHIQPE